MKTLEQINKEASDKVSVAQPILNKIITNTSLRDFHDPVLSRLGDSRWRGHFVRDTLNEVINLYSTRNHNEMLKPIQDFVKDANKFFYGHSN